MRVARFAFVLVFLTACGKDPVGQGRECNLAQLNLAATRIAVSEIHGPIRLSTLAGAQERTLITGNVNAQDWAPQRDRLVYVDDRGFFEYALSVADTLGVTRQLPVPLRSTWPVWSRDGWIYFFTQNDAPPEIRRIRPDGTNLSTSFVRGRFPAPAPDGENFAYTDSGKIWIYNLTTNVSTPVTDANAIALRWSPDGNWIAYIAGGQTTIVRPDGTAKQVVGPNSVGGLSWSPDACFLLAGSEYNNMVVIDPHQGLLRSLSIVGLYTAWRP